MHDFSRKIFFTCFSYSINRPNFIVWFPSFLEILGNMCFVAACFPGYDIKLILRLTFFLHGQKVKRKIQISWEQRELLRWNKKHFLSLLKVFQLSKIVSDLQSVPLNHQVIQITKNIKKTSYSLPPKIQFHQQEHFPHGNSLLENILYITAMIHHQ